MLSFAIPASMYCTSCAIPEGVRFSRWRSQLVEQEELEKIQLHCTSHRYSTEDITLLISQGGWCNEPNTTGGFSTTSLNWILCTSHSRNLLFKG